MPPHRHRERWRVAVGYSPDLLRFCTRAGEPEYRQTDQSLEAFGTNYHPVTLFCNYNKSLPAPRDFTQTYLAGPTGFEPAISSVTGRRDRPLHYEPMPNYR